MKANIHPDVKDCTVTCACGATFTTKSIKDKQLYAPNGELITAELTTEVRIIVVIVISFKPFGEDLRSDALDIHLFNAFIKLVHLVFRHVIIRFVDVRVDLRAETFRLQAVRLVDSKLRISFGNNKFFFFPFTAYGKSRRHHKA